MPTYDYKCPKCGTEFQEFQKITAKAGAKCPECGTKAERQLSGGGGLVFKGSGFYLTDYGRGGQKKPAADASEGGGGESKKADKPDASKPSTESKPKKKKDD